MLGVLQLISEGPLMPAMGGMMFCRIVMTVFVAQALFLSVATSVYIPVTVCVSAEDVKTRMVSALSETAPGNIHTKSAFALVLVAPSTSLGLKQVRMWLGITAARSGPSVC